MWRTYVLRRRPPQAPPLLLLDPPAKRVFPFPAARPKSAPKNSASPRGECATPGALLRAEKCANPGASFIQRSVPTRALPEWDKCAPRAFSRVGKCATCRVRLSSGGVCIQRLPKAGKCATSRAPPRSRSVPQQARPFQAGARIGQPLPPERTFGAPCPPPAGKCAPPGPRLPGGSVRFSVRRSPCALHP